MHTTALILVMTGLFVAVFGVVMNRGGLWTVAVTAFLVLVALVRWVLANGQDYLAYLQPGLVTIFVAAVVTVGTLPLLLSRRFRQAIDATPTQHLVAIHGLRLVGGYFLTLADAGLLPQAFAIPAGYGDVAVALASLALAYGVARGVPGRRTLVLVWTALSLYDLVNALLVGAQTIAPFAKALAASGTPLQYLGTVLLIPSVIVPLLLVTNVYVLFQIRPRAAAPTLA